MNIIMFKIIQQYIIYMYFYIYNLCSACPYHVLFRGPIRNRLSTFDTENPFSLIELNDDHFFNPFATSVSKLRDIRFTGSKMVD